MRRLQALQYVYPPDLLSWSESLGLLSRRSSQVIQFVAICFLIGAVNQSAWSQSADSAIARRYEEVQRPKAIPWLFASVSSDSWKIDPPTATSSDGLGFGLGASFRKPIARSPFWSFVFEVILRKYADQTLSTSAWQETVEEKILRFNLLVTYTFRKLPLKPYVGTGVFFGAGLNTGSGQPGGSIVPSPFCGVSGWLLNGGVHITNDLLLDFRYEAGGSTGFRVTQASILVKMGD